MIGFIFFIAILAFVLFLLKAFLATVETGSFRSRKNLLSNAELHFFKCLSSILPDQYHLMSKVGLKDVVSSSSISQKQRSSDWGRIKSKHIDFVVIEKATSSIVSCIELDDSSHNSLSAQKRDAIKDIAFRSAGIPFHRIRVSSSYDVETLRKVYP